MENGILRRTEKSTSIFDPSSLLSFDFRALLVLLDDIQGSIVMFSWSWSLNSTGKIDACVPRLGFTAVTFAV